MKRNHLIAIGILVIFITAGVLVAGCSSAPKPPVNITYYYAQNCSECLKMDDVFANLTTYHSGEFTLTKYDINAEPVKVYNDQIKYKWDGSVPFVIIGNMNFTGYTPDDNDYARFEKLVINR